MCQKYIYEYIDKIEKIVEDGIRAGQIKNGSAKVIASEIYALIASTLVYKMRNQENVEIIKLYKEFESTIIEGIKQK